MKTNFSAKLERFGRLVRIGLVLLCALVIVQCLFDPLSWLGNIFRTEMTRRELPGARTRWHSRGITDYSLDVEGFVPLACTIDATLTVEEGKLAAVMSRGVPVEADRWDDPFCSYSQLVIPSMFGEVERWLGDIDPAMDSLEVSFDPEFGYITHYGHRSCYRRGILNPVCSDNHVWFTFTNFQPITDTVSP
jgi:hypothetical protein